MSAEFWDDDNDRVYRQITNNNIQGKEDIDKMKEILIKESNTYSEQDLKKLKEEHQQEIKKIKKAAEMQMRNVKMFARDRQRQVLEKMVEKIKVIFDSEMLKLIGEVNLIKD